jgi:glycosyltransferase involved in cell wall biosynthesis
LPEHGEGIPKLEHGGYTLHMLRKRILLLSAYDAISHQQWRKGLVTAFPEYEWSVLTLPPRHFSWRIRGNSLTWAISEDDTLKQSFDLIIATSMTDLSALKGMRPSLAVVPTLLYFHENQFAYPESGMEHPSIEPRITSIYAAMSATRIAFNSDYNRKTFLHGSKALLNKMPDHVPPGVDKLLTQKSCILPVPLNDLLFQSVEQERGGSFTILWNHRWEYDKAPERFFSALCMLKERGVSFSLNVVGQHFRSTPAVFNQMKEELSDHIGAWGYIDSRAEYLAIIRQSHVVVSTALHDFQGLGILEATAAGCIPCVPDRLAYREYIPEQFRFTSSPNCIETESEALACRLMELAELHQTGMLSPAPDVSHLSWEAMRQRYGTLIDRIMFN